MARCTGIKYLNECDNAILLENGFGCSYGMDCEYQRPKITKYNNKYTASQATPKSCKNCKHRSIAKKECKDCISTAYLNHELA